jgi:tRNA G37 N-methylase Trm5
MVLCPCVSAERNRAEEVRRALLRAGALRTDLRPRKEGERVLFPVNDPDAVRDLLRRLRVEFRTSFKLLLDVGFSQTMKVRIVPAVGEGNDPQLEGSDLFSLWP